MSILRHIWHGSMNESGLQDHLIAESDLTAVLDECYAANKGETITYFEITTCAAILAFSRVQADYTLLEVGLGGRLDATKCHCHARADDVSPPSLLITRSFSATQLPKSPLKKPGSSNEVCPALLARNQTTHLKRSNIKQCAKALRF